MNYQLILFGLLLLFASCNKDHSQNPVAPDNRTLQEKYDDAVRDAMIADSSEIVPTLIAITRSDTIVRWTGMAPDERVLVVTWTRHISSYPVNDTVTTSWGDVWVTVVPEMRYFFTSHPTPRENLTLRSEQLLGLPINKGYTHFVELWVRPADLFRPSPDNEVTDHTAQLAFPASADSAYRAWFSDNFFYSYFTKPTPWTRLGYTYDWGNPDSDVGLSEFVVRKNSRVVVKSLSTTDEYLTE